MVYRSPLNEFAVSNGLQNQDKSCQFVIAALGALPRCSDVQIVLKNDKYNVIMLFRQTCIASC
jgi:hypothetical protein